MKLSEIKDGELFTYTWSKKPMKRLEAIAPFSVRCESISKGKLVICFFPDDMEVKKWYKQNVKNVILKQNNSLDYEESN